MNRTALPVRRERSRNNRNRTQISASTGPSAPLENPRGHRPTIDKDGPTAATFHTLATALTKPMRAHPSTPSHQPARNNPDEAAPPQSTRRAAAARRRVLRRRGPKNTRDGSSDNGGSARQPGTGYAHHRTHHEPSRRPEQAAQLEPVVYGCLYEAGFSTTGATPAGRCRDRPQHPRRTATGRRHADPLRPHRCRDRRHHRLHPHTPSIGCPERLPTRLPVAINGSLDHRTEMTSTLHQRCTGHRSRGRSKTSPAVDASN